jgi:hypothetical protein
MLIGLHGSNGKYVSGDICKSQAVWASFQSVT